MAITATPTLDDAALKGKNRKLVTVKFALTGTYETGGFAITANNLGATAIEDVVSVYIDGDDLFGVFDPDNSKIILRGHPEATGTITDDDSATTNGTDVFITLLDGGVTGIPIAYLESTTANNADALYQLGSSGPSIQINDNDSPASDELYFDEDAASADRRLLHDMAIARDVFLVCTDGRLVRVAYDASASSNGVALHFDDDAANAYERLLFVSPTDTDGTFETDDDLSWRSASAELQAGDSVAVDCWVTAKVR